MPRKKEVPAGEEPAEVRRSSRSKPAAAVAAAAASVKKAVKPRSKKGDEAPKAASQLKEGDTLDTSIEVTTDEDKTVPLASLLRSGVGVVFFVYPRANTGGCTTQACAFRDSYAEFEQLGYQVFGVSTDSPKSQTSWKTKQNLPYPLLCDPKRATLLPLLAAKPARSHAVFDKDLKLTLISNGVKPADSSKDVLAFIKGGSSQAAAPAVDAAPATEGAPAAAPEPTIAA